ncbi:MAG: prepilin-type N-terminal cleavage/methylation domain-containing protein [Rhodoferax sp.]|jgi:general secretion pathway protein G|nr:prepilin-type N-terminal cleavage/methylation domain-containing protein [Rhodoferax sp.]
MVNGMGNLSLVRHHQHGFTLIELVVVLAIVALLLSLATPHYFHRLDKSKETILRANLAATRDVLDKFYGDTGKYPERLETLVEKKYLRSMPFDPITESSQTWIIVAPDTPEKGGVFDIHSAAEGNSSDGTPYSEW